MRNPFYLGLFHLLLKTDEIAGPVWAWRVTRLAHAIPFYAAAYGFGWLFTWAWGDPFSRHIGGALCAGLVMLLTARDWYKDWRQGY